jgi:23S rRNA pseudouridine2605 synthase
MKDTRKPGGPRKPGGASGKRAEGGRPFRKDSPDTGGFAKTGGRGDGPRSDGARKDGGRKDAPGKPRTARPAKANPAHIAVSGEGERISKVMARAGVASRRDCERMILDGRVTLNGKVLDSPAVNVTGEDRIEVDGKAIGAIERTRLWIYYKPAGLVTTNFDPEGRPTVFDNLPPDLPRVISVGRLDINTEGLLLLTNDGGLARMLELPSTGWLRRYRVRAYGAIDQARLDALREGIAVDGVLYGAIEATLDREQGHNVWITMGLREGKNREIKNVLGALGLEVNRLIRISYGPFQLGELEDGQVVEVKSRTLREQLGPRLIEEANANFEAPINNPQVTEKDEPEGDWAVRPRRESREERRDRDLARIDTRKPERGFKERGGDRGERGRGRDDRDEKRPKRPPLGTSRTANVWMAPGARPVAPKKNKPAAEEAAVETGPKRRVLRLKTDGAETSETAAKTERKSPARRAATVRKATSDRSERGDRPARSDRAARNDRPAREERAERPARSRPTRTANKEPADREDRQTRSFAKPRNPEGDKPRGRPASARAGRTEPEGLGDRPRSERPRTPRATADRSEGDRARGERPGRDQGRNDGKGPGRGPGKGPGSGPGKGPGKGTGGGPSKGSRGPGRGADRRR